MTSKVKSRNKLLSSHKKSSLAKSSTKDELLALKYSMDRPCLPVYALEEASAIDGTRSKSTGEEAAASQDLTYPDFIPWKDHTQISKEKQVSNQRESDEQTYLSKGYFEAPHVSNEYYSGRNLASAALFSSNENCLNVVNEISRYLTNAYKSRNENINKIRYSAGNFKIPQKITLTASKRENWLNELSNSDVPLKKIGERIPHGIRGKVLIDALCARFTPMNRALWFTKCVLFSEILALRRKYQSKMPPESTSSEKFELHWLQDWTQQVAACMFKMAQDMMETQDIASKEYLIKKLSYLRELVSSLYVETLLDKPYLLSLVLKPLKDGLPQNSDAVGDLVRSRQADDEDNQDTLIQDELNFAIDYAQRFSSLVWIKTFWNDIIAVDYLAKELGEGLLLNHFYVSKLSRYPKWFLPEHLRDNLLKSLSDMIVYLFKRNTNTFVIPGNWAITRESLASILSHEMCSMSPSESKKLADQLELINYRNDSLIINLSRSETIVKLPSSGDPQDANANDRKDVRIPSGEKKFKGDLSNSAKLMDELDHLRFNEKLAKQLRPQNGPHINENWIHSLRTVLLWSVSPWRYSEVQNENILVMCNFLKKTLFTAAEISTRVEVENEILDSIMTFLELNSGLVDSSKLYVMVNELYQLKVITIASYIRKIIASGVFYTTLAENNLSEMSSTTQNHLHFLVNLPVLNNKQCDSILRKWTTDGFNFKGAFEQTKHQLQSQILDKLFSNKSIETPPDFDKEWRSCKTGLKFLLVNWLTDEFKTRLASSPKLVIFTPDILANLYKYYAISDNLPVFFKVIVQAILRNQSRMAILYSDGLFLIARLVMRHFKLLKQFSDSTNSSTIANLFRSIMQNFQELSQREFIVYNFHQVWSFIDAVTEKDGSSCRKRKREDGPEFGGYGTLPERNNSFGTPMQIQSVDLRSGHTPKVSDSYSSDDFRTDLAALKAYKAKPLSESELRELREISADVSLESHLKIWFSQIKGLSESSEVGIVKFWKHLTLGVPWEKVEEVTKTVLKDAMQSDYDLPTKVLILKKLVVYDISSYGDILKLVVSLEKSYSEPLIRHMPLVPSFSKHPDLSAAQSQLYNISLYFFKERNKQEYTALVSNAFIIGGLRNNDYSDERKVELKKFLSQSLLTQEQYVFNQIFLKIDRNECLFLLNLCLNRSEDTSINLLSDLEENLEEINEFNLRIYQVLLCVLSLNLDIKDKAATTKRWRCFIENFLSKSEFLERSIFGSLFYWVPWEHKLTILEIFENKIFSELKVDKNPVALTLNGIDIGRAVSDFIDIFLATAVDTVASSNSFISNCCQFLADINNVINKEVSQECHTGLETLLSIVLKILIIHKPSICTFIAKNLTGDLAENFVKNLIRILDSKYMRTHSQKLRVLFHDLLLLMKTSVNDEITTVAEHNLHEQHSAEEFRQKEAALMDSLPTTAQVQSLFSIPDLDEEDPFKGTFSDRQIKCAIMLDKEELARGGDANRMNHGAFKLQVPKADSLNIPDIMGNILRNGKTGDQGEEHLKTCIRPFRIRSYELLEDTSSALNDACINLSLFNAYKSEENPP
ncbi:SRB8 [Candida theae]|uniref:Mediator of RNA polymerase II transcription subunit 12 n=1 Tax=Candida theae TaxID=1198502 RepID=A0AAD5BFM0_9ASCO|nr:SRB8 [Candida theae]KAI5959339.1 SRB8 [Candida theae]